MMGISRRVLVGTLGAALALVPAGAVAVSPPPKDGGSGAGHGANQPGPYDPNGVGEPSGNGKSEDNNGKRPCAGCVGNADAKNPPGQMPGGSDGNAGYECDRNQGVGKTNPAHSGCGAAPPVDCATAEGARRIAARQPAAIARPTPTTYAVVHARRVAALPRVRPMRSCRLAAYGVS